MMTSNNSRKTIIISVCVALTVMVLQIGEVYAIQYCVGDISYDNFTHDGIEHSSLENCSIQGVSCNEGLGCDPPEIAQLPIQGFIIMMLVIIILWAIKTRRR